MFEKVFYGNTLKDWIISLVIILVAFLLNKGIVLFNRHVLKRATQKSRNKLDDLLIDALESPLLLGILLLAIWIATSRLTLTPKIHDVISKSYQILVVLNITWFFARLVSSLIDEFVTFEKDPGRKEHKRLDNKLVPLMKRVFLIIIWTIGIVTALNNVGVKVTTLLGTLGIGGIAFALAAQDTIKNIFGGITIFTDHPFRIGDTIRADTLEGTVEDIGIRSTRVRTYDNQLVTIPNYKLMDTLVTNISIEPSRRVVLKLRLTYDTKPDQMRKALDMLKEIAKKTEELEDDGMTATFSDYGDSALVITFIYFIRKSADIMLTNSKVNFEILNSFNEAGLVFAFPTRTVQLKNMSEPEMIKTAEITQKPEKNGNDS